MIQLLLCLALYELKVRPYFSTTGFSKNLFDEFLARLHEVQKSYCSHPGRTRSRSTLLKFSRSLYLDNQLSESIHTWTIGTL